MEVLWNQLEVCNTSEVGGTMLGYMEAHESFARTRLYSWKLQSMEAMEASTSTNSGNVHAFPWKLPTTSMEVNLLPPTSMDISTDL